LLDIDNGDTHKKKKKGWLRAVLLGGGDFFLFSPFRLAVPWTSSRFASSSPSWG
jgi:hypothetical protein